MTSLVKIVLGVWRKELTSSLRDRQTLIYMVVLPFAMYPLLFWVLLQGASFLRGEDEVRSVTVGLIDPRPAPLSTATRVADALQGSPAGLRHPGPIEIVEVPSAAALPELVSGRKAPFDALLRWEPGSEETGGATLVLDSTRSTSSLARNRVEERLARLAVEWRDEAMRAAASDPSELVVLRTQEHDVSSRSDRGAYVFSLLLPLMFVFMGILGAFFPAVDVTAGEKERGTLETTCLLPVPRGAVHLGKVLAVSTAATVAAAMNLLGMALAAEHLLSGMARDGAAFEILIPWARLFAVLPLGVLFLVTVSAFLVAAASFTDTFKQGQSLLGAVQLILIAPAFVAIMPGLELTPGLAAIPVVQTAMAFRSILQEGSAVDPGLLAIVALTQLLYAAVATWIAVRCAARERTLFTRSPRKRRAALLARG